MRGRLIVIEGTDGSGKSTQFGQLCQRLDAMGQGYKKLVFPQYQEPSSALIRMYLGGEFGSHPGDVNPYAASAFYAVDRYASLKKVWGEYYDGGAWSLPTGIPPPTRSTRGPSAQRGSGPPSSAGWTILNTTSWDCPGLTWCSIWICLPKSRWSCCAAGVGHPYQGGHP